VPSGSVERPDVACALVTEADVSTEDWRASQAILRPPRRGRVRVTVALARPRQWIKNGLVIAAAGAAGILGQDDVLGRVLVATAAFCLLSAGTYALNDVRDRDEDRNHPRKRLRPVAAGEMSPREATLTGLAWLTAGIVLCGIISPLLAAVGVGYVALTFSYSRLWRNVPILDLAVLSAGFVLRAVAGGAAVPVGLSRWFLLVVTFAAVLAAVGKRLGELTRVQAIGGSARRVLVHYGIRRLRILLVISSAGAVCAYGMWALRGPTPAGLPWRALTMIPFVVCLVRYATLVLRGGGEAPEQLIFSDRLLMLAGLCWLTLFVLDVNATT
jgi:decaprenyl-phosphate phosphoribosyltransferase